MEGALTLSILEIILLCFGAIILGITIHFTIASRRSLKASMSEKSEVNKFRDEWKSRYFNDIEIKDKELSLLKDQIAGSGRELSELRMQLSEAEENTNIYSIEAEEMRKENKKLQTQLDSMHSAPRMVAIPSVDKSDYLEQLREAQSNLMEHNDKINQLLDNIDAFKEREERQREILKMNEELASQVSDLKAMLEDKEREIIGIRQKEHLTKEMTSMLDNAYSEFNVLQSKMQKLELQVSSSKMINMEYEDLKESNHKISKELEEQRQKLAALTAENQNLQAQLVENQDKLREANFQRQQLQKRVAYLEELNGDMQAVADANKKLEGQLKRIGELESMLHVVAEERDQLMRRAEK